MRWYAGSKLVNGVFKGGGAKGIAYVGAVQAFAERGLWFGSVAGASAGAITATLIAAGLKPEEIEECVPKALRSVKRSLLGLIVGRAHALYSSDGLTTWMNHVLSRRAPSPKTDSMSDGWVTFEELYKATGIGLYVVTMDLATAEPVVFHHCLTPEVPVARAVAASSAIPAAFPPGRALIRTSQGMVIHTLVDGGAWANYPAFVFKDSSFRAWIGATGGAKEFHDEGERSTVGFTLGETPEPPVQPSAMLSPNQRVTAKYDLGTGQTSGSKALYMLALVLGNPVVRLILIISMVVGLWVGLTGLANAFRNLSVSTILWPSPLSTLVPFILGSVMLAGFLGATVGVILTLLVGRAAATTLLPAARAALGVATGVAPWVGWATDDCVVQLEASGIGTTDFSIAQHVQHDVISVARKATAEFLDERPGFPEDMTRAAPPQPAVRTEEDTLFVKDPGGAAFAGILVCTFAATGALVALSYGVPIGAAVLGLGALVALWWAAGRLSKLDLHVARKPIGEDLILPLLVPGFFFFMGLATVVFGAYSIAQEMSGLRARVAEVTVSSATLSAGGGYVYQVRGTWLRSGEPKTFAATVLSFEQLNVGQKVLLERDPDKDGRLAVYYSSPEASVLLLAWGGFFLAWGMREGRANIRARRLRALFPTTQSD